MAKLVKFQSLKDEMYLKRESNEDLAKLLKLSPVTIYKKLRGEVRWFDNEIKIICEHYNKPFEELFKCED